MYNLDEHGVIFLWLLCCFSIMMIVSFCVVNKHSHKTLLKWKVVKCEVENTVGQFFSVVRLQLSCIVYFQLVYY